MSSAWLDKQLHESAVPADPSWHDDPPFARKTLMVYKVMIEILVGVRPYIAAWWARVCRVKIFGKAALNLAKLEEEGEFTETTCN